MYSTNCSYLLPICSSHPWPPVAMSSLNKVSSFNNFHICLLSHLRVKFDGLSELDDSVQHISIQLGLSLCTERNSPVKATSWAAGGCSLTGKKHLKCCEISNSNKLYDGPLLSTLRLQLRTDWTLPRMNHTAKD